ncbi:MAG: hypothetical protein M0Z29_00820 [Actinomycetota bacterium]|nr:hypothetical protein [Actinomycetota bacterium]
MRGRRPAAAVLGILALLALGVDPVAAAAAPGVGSVVIQTVPSLPGVMIRLGGLSAVSDGAGQATFSAVPLTDAMARVGVKAQVVSDGLRVRLYRVARDPNHPSFQRRLLVELAEDRRVDIAVVTPEGKRVDPSGITQLSMTDNLGSALALSGKQLARPVWLESLVPAFGKDGIYGRLVTYTLQSVTVSGSNVVNQGQLHLIPFWASTWVIHGLFFDLSVRATDALAGSPAGTKVKLVFPDKSNITQAMGSLHSVRFVDIPRGDYTVIVQGGVMNLRSPLRLSRNQELSEKVVTTGDASLLMLVVLGGAALLHAFGNYRRRTAPRPAGGGRFP